VLDPSRLSSGVSTGVHAGQRSAAVVFLAQQGVVVVEGGDGVGRGVELAGPLDSVGRWRTSRPDDADADTTHAAATSRNLPVRAHNPAVRPMPCVVPAPSPSRHDRRTRQAGVNTHPVPGCTRDPKHTDDPSGRRDRRTPPVIQGRPRPPAPYSVSALVSLPTS
jgi:hypothetical protein